MATPHVVGVVAEMLQSTPTVTPQTISTNLLNQGKRPLNPIPIF